MAALLRAAAARRAGGTAGSQQSVAFEFESMVPFYLVFGFASMVGTAAVIAVSRRVRDHPSAIILIITLVDLLYTLKCVRSEREKAGAARAAHGLPTPERRGEPCDGSTQAALGTCAGEPVTA
jgi:hypothetical protein